MKIKISVSFILALGFIVTQSSLAFSTPPQFTKVKVVGITGWKDSVSGLVIGNIKENVASLAEAEANCPEPWHAPSFGDPAQIGQSGDLSILFRDGITAIVPALVGKSFWLTAPLSPYYETIEFTSDTEHPISYNYGASDGSISSVCITQ